MKKSAKTEKEDFYCRVALHFYSDHRSCPSQWWGKRAAPRNVEISKQLFFSNLRESHDITTTNNCNWCDSRQVCHICSMTNGQKNDAVTVSSSVEAKNIHKKGDPMTTRHHQLVGNFRENQLRHRRDYRERKNPTSSFLLSYVCYLVWSHTGDSLEKNCIANKSSFVKKGNI